MSDRLLKESDVMRIAFQLPYVVNSAFVDAVKALPSADRPQGIYDLIALVNKETEREDLSDKIKEYLFCDLRKKLWGLDVRPKLGEPIHIPEGTLMREIGAWFDRNPGRAILVERHETERGPKYIATIEEIMPIGKMQEMLEDDRR